MDKRQMRAFEGFAAASGAELLRIATLLTPDPHTAEDVYQETLQRLAARWSRVENPKAFCRQVMLNIVRDQARARARRPRELELRDGTEPGDPRSADPHVAVELRPSRLASSPSVTGTATAARLRRPTRPRPPSHRPERRRPRPLR